MIIVNKIKRIVGRVIVKRFFFRLYEHYRRQDEALRQKMTAILKLDESAIHLGRDDQEEQAIPGMTRYVRNGWYKYMFGRYLYSLPVIRDKTVLDAGCGLGWGSYLIADYPKSLTAVDNDTTAINFARKNWGTAADYHEMSVLDLEQLGKKFEIVLGYEVIEHLDYDDGRKYIENISKVLTDVGMVILSSDFPDSARVARDLESRNIYHLHVYTKDEIRDILRDNHFQDIRFLGDMMVTARKVGTIPCGS